MNIEYFVRPEHNLVVFVQTGRVPDDQFLNFYKSFFESDAFDLPLNILVDLRETSSSSRSPETLLRFAELAEKKLADVDNRTKVAVVAPRDTSFGLARMYEILSGPVDWDFVVFRATAAALAWLGLPENLSVHSS